MSKAARLRTLVCVVLLTGSRPVLAGEPAAPATRAEPPKSSPRALLVFPNKITLDGPRDEQRLGVVGDYADGRKLDLSRQAKYTSNGKVVRVTADGIVTPVVDGEADITIAAWGRTAVVPVRARNVAAEVPVSFTREIVPVLTKAGCNQGACHGGQHGRGGFKLSLLGFDPMFDYPQIVQSAEGRRVVLSDPERSILLLKPTLTMEHGGGERFKVGSPSYQLLRRWLEDGAPEATAQDPVVTRLEVTPRRELMTPGARQQ